jgi:hypothetical protein
MQQQWKDAYPGLFGKMVCWISLAGGRDIEQGSYSALYVYLIVQSCPIAMLMRVSI